MKVDGAVEIRAYTDADAESTLTVYLRAIRETASADYSAEQVEAWAAGHGDIESWAASRRVAGTRLAFVDGRLAGFTDLRDEGYVDMLFVNPDFARMGVATTLLAETIATARRRGMPVLTTHASITARPFFERQGFVVTAECHPVVRGVETTNYAMSCSLGSAAEDGIGWTAVSHGSTIAEDVAHPDAHDPPQ